MICYSFNVLSQIQINSVFGTEQIVKISHVLKLNLILLRLVKHSYNIVLSITQVQNLMGVHIFLIFVTIMCMNRIALKVMQMVNVFGIKKHLLMNVNQELVLILIKLQVIQLVIIILKFAQLIILKLDAQKDLINVLSI